MTKVSKIAHISDIHIQKVPTRHQEYREVFERTYKSLKQNKPDRIVLAGDLFHNYIELQTEQVVLAGEFLNNLSKIAPVIVSRGNHDFRRKSSKRLDSVQAIIKNINNDKVRYLDSVGFFEDDNVVWVNWHHGVPNNNPWKTKRGKEILKNKDKSKTYVDIFHDPINGGKMVTGISINKKSYYKLSDFKGDYSLYGDIHLKQVFSNSTKAYSGSLIAQDFSEGDNQFHGYLLWDIENGNLEEVPIYNDYSFKNFELTSFTDFDDLDDEIENPTKYMKIRILWKTLPSIRNSENERKITEYLKNKYPDSIISNKNEFLEDDTIEVNEDLNVDDISDQEIQHTIFKDYLDKIGVDEKMIEDILKLDDELTKNLEIEKNTNIEWNVIKFGGTNFMSYDSIEIDWRDFDGLYQITGKNAGGKTTIFKLLSYILYNKTLETESRVKFGDYRYVNNKTNIDQCSGYLILEVNGEYYGIERITTIERKKDDTIKGAPTKVQYHKLSTPDDEFTDENSLDNLNEDNRIQTQKRIDEIIGTYDNFMRVVLTTSDTLNRILSNDMAVFVDSILSDSGLDIFDKKLEEGKDYKKEFQNKSRVTCNITQTEEQIKGLENDITIIENEIKKIEDVDIPNIKDRIYRGENYIDDERKKMYEINPEIANLNVDNTKGNIQTYEGEISQLEAKKVGLESSIDDLIESYDQDKLNLLNEKKDEHKTIEHNLKLEIKGVESEIEGEEHKIEIVNGENYRLKQDGAQKKKEISELKESKTCPTCGQPITEEHQNHVDEKIKSIEKEMFGIARKIKENERKIEDEHRTKIKSLKEKIKSFEFDIQTKSEEMETILEEIGKLTNQKNDVEKRKELTLELNQIPIKIENEQLKKKSLEDKLEEFYKLEKRISENESINKKIGGAKKLLEVLREEEQTYREQIINKKNNIETNKKDIVEKKTLISEFKDQEYQDELIKTYLKCVHRDGIPRQLLVNNIIPKINKELENILSVAPFKVWLDSDDLRPKLAYYNNLGAVIDAIGSSGKERTFASIVLKTALNQINVKSKPSIFLLDEVMGKLDNEGSVDEFIEILKLINERYKKVLVVEHNHEINPDKIISVTKNNRGISTAVVE